MHCLGGVKVVSLGQALECSSLLVSCRYEIMGTGLAGRLQVYGYNYVGPQGKGLHGRQGCC